MPRKSLDITETELAILSVLWAKGTATIRVTGHFKTDQLWALQNRQPCECSV